MVDGVVLIVLLAVVVAYLVFRFRNIKLSKEPSPLTELD